MSHSERPRSASIDGSENILAPVPRRLHLDTSTRHWLGHASVSPSSSRAGSPSLTSRSPALQSVSARLGSPRPNRSRTFSSAFKTIADLDSPHHGGTAKRWIRWMSDRNLKGWILPVLLAVATLVKICISLASYSGHNTPPMYGDYEAQRHWMEITLHLPVEKWYFYDLQYWGLDYPPLTAYVSWVCGVIGARINPEWFALDSSRGIETPGSKLYLRITVLATDFLIYVLPVYLFSRTWHRTRSRKTQNLALVVCLLQPALLLIDFGHFQYNGVMLGLTLQAMNFFVDGRDLLGAVCFVLSLGFKQMALYYAPAIGGYLLAKCIYLGCPAGLKLFTKLGLTVIATMLILFYPFLPSISSLREEGIFAQSIRQPIIRIFPFGRGLFEDKVANFWCASSVVIKWRTWMQDTSLIRMSTVLTALGFAPGVAIMLYIAFSMRQKGGQVVVDTKTTALLPLLPYTLLNSSLSFFLFSFQVHEKTILVPLLPMTLLFSGSLSGDVEEIFELGALMINAAVFSMWPLLKRDGLGLPYCALLALWNRFIGYNPFHSPASVDLKTLSKVQGLHIISFAFHAAAAGLHVLELLVSPPARYPDLFTVLNVLFSTPIFMIIWLWSLQRCLQVAWAVVGISGGDVQARQGGERVSTQDLGRPMLQPLISGRRRTSSTLSASSTTARRRKTTLASSQEVFSESTGTPTPTQNVIPEGEMR